MSNESHDFPPLFRIDVSADPRSIPAATQYDPNTVIIDRKSTRLNSSH